MGINLTKSDEIVAQRRERLVILLTTYETEYSSASAILSEKESLSFKGQAETRLKNELAHAKEQTNQVIALLGRVTSDSSKDMEPIINEVIQLHDLLSQRRLALLTQSEEVKQRSEWRKTYTEGTNSELNFQTVDALLMDPSWTNTRLALCFGLGVPVALFTGLVGAVGFPLFIFFALLLTAGAGFAGLSAGAAPILGIVMIAAVAITALIGLLGGIFVGASFIYNCFKPELSADKQAAKRLINRMKEDVAILNQEEPIVEKTDSTAPVLY